MLSVSLTASSVTSWLPVRKRVGAALVVVPHLDGVAGFELLLAGGAGKGRFQLEERGHQIGAEELQRLDLVERLGLDDDALAGIHVRLAGNEALGVVVVEAQRE